MAEQSPMPADALAEALEPFAKAADKVEQTVSNVERFGQGKLGDNATSGFGVLFGDFRRARAVLDQYRAAQATGAGGVAVPAEVHNLIRSTKALLDYFNPAALAEDKSRQWYAVLDQIQRVEAMLAAAPQPIPVRPEACGIWPDFIAPPRYSNPAEGWDDPALPDFRVIWQTARSLGYAVGLHGSMARDCDLIAAPWVNGAGPASDLIAALCAALNARQVGETEQKPHGRIAVTLQIDGWYKSIDLSVMPMPIPVRTYEEGVEAAARIAEGIRYQERYRTFSWWPNSDKANPPNRANDSELVWHADETASAIRALISPPPGGGLGASFGPGHSDKPEPVPVSALTGECPSRDLWQPAESALKDGSDMLVWGPNIGYAVVGIEEPESTHPWAAEEGVRYHRDAFTHWMPLPPAPAHPSREGGAK